MWSFTFHRVGELILSHGTPVNWRHIINPVIAKFGPIDRLGHLEFHLYGDTSDASGLIIDGNSVWDMCISKSDINSKHCAL